MFLCFIFHYLYFCIKILSFLIFIFIFISGPFPLSFALVGDEITYMRQSAVLYLCVAT